MERIACAGLTGRTSKAQSAFHALLRAAPPSRDLPMTIPPSAAQPSQPTLRSFALRALLGLAIMFVVVSGAAWLWYAAIDRDQEAADAAAASATVSEH
jgi:hypothetical protein